MTNNNVSTQHSIQLEGSAQPSSFLEGSPENPHEKYTDEWYKWENDRLHAEKLKEWLDTDETIREVISRQSEPEPELTRSGALIDIERLVRENFDPTVEKLQLLALKDKYSGLISSYDFDQLVKEVKNEKAQANRGERLRLDILVWNNETDPINKLMLKGQICSHYRISGKELEALALSLDKGCDIIKAKRYSGAEFLKLEAEGLKWLVPGLIPGRGVTILAGAAGSGKSTLAYDLAASVLYGDKFLGEPPVETGKVLFLGGDELPCFVQDKLINRGFNFNQDWEFITDWDVTQKKVLEEALEDLKPKLVVIDSFSSIHNDPSFDENSAQAKATIYWLEKLLNRYNTAALLLHHTNKAKDQKGVGKVRGSSAIVAAASAVFLLEGEGNVRTLSSPKIRGAEPIRWTIAMDATTGHSRVVEGKFDDDNSKTIADKILDFFKTKCSVQRLEFSQIFEAIGGFKDAIYKGLDRLIKRGLLVKRPSSVDPRRRVWGLPKDVGQPLDCSVQQPQGHSPPPTPSNLSNIISENNTQQGLEDVGQILDGCWTDVGNNQEIEACLTTSNPDTASNPEIILDSSSSEGGECVLDAAVQADCQAEVTTYQVGDRVISTMTGRSGEVVEVLENNDYCVRFDDGQPSFGCPYGRSLKPEPKFVQPDLWD